MIQGDVTEELGIIHELEGHLSGIPHVVATPGAIIRWGSEETLLRHFKCVCGVQVILTGAAR